MRGSLARRLAAGVLQALSDSSPLSERPRSTVPVDYCVPAAGADTRRQLRSSDRQRLAVTVPRYRLNT